MKKKTRKQTRKHITHTDTHIWLKKGLFIYAVIVFLAFVLISLSTYALVNTIQHQRNQARLDRINEIYSSLDLDGSYRMARSDVFGDKRVYTWDEDRSYSSSIEYGRNASVDATRSDLRSRILAAGFEEVGVEYEGSANEQQHYKSNDDEYIRVQVANSEWYNSLLYGTELPSPEELQRGDASPVYVTIKVNLDNNNE